MKKEEEIKKIRGEIVKLERLKKQRPADKKLDKLLKMEETKLLKISLVPCFVNTRGW